MYEKITISFIPSFVSIMTYQNQTIPNYGNADESSLFLTDSAASPSSLSFGQEETVKAKQKKKPSIVCMAGGVAGFMLLAVASGYYSVISAAPASISIASEKNELRVGVGVGYKYDTCYPAGDSFSGVSVDGWQEDHAFETCYADGSKTSTTRCWSHSFYYRYWLPEGIDGWYACDPNGDGWVTADLSKSELKFFRKKFKK